MVIQIIKLKSELPEEDLLRTAQDRKPKFEEIPGLIQKYYVKFDNPGEYAGVYIWDSKESIQAFRQTDLAASIPQAYQLIEAPNIDIGEVLFQLRD